jgi:hypothetical protein
LAGVVDLEDVFRMLDACAHEHKRKPGNHYWCVMWNGKEYPTLPTGAKSDRRKEVQLRKVAKMVQVLGIDADCAIKHLPQLANVIKRDKVKADEIATPE